MTKQELIHNLKLIKSAIEWDYPLDFAATIEEAVEVIENGQSEAKNG